MSRAQSVASPRLRPAYAEPAAARLVGLGVLGLVGLAGLVQIGRVGRGASRGLGKRGPPRSREPPAGYASVETRGLHGAAALLALSVLAR